MSKTVIVYFLIDTSGSMEGRKMDSLNQFLRELVPEIKDLAESGENELEAKIKFAVIDYSSGARLVTKSGPVPIEEFTWQYLTALGVTDMGAAFKILNELFAKNTASSDIGRAIFLFTDGEPTDDWKAELNILKKNEKFNQAVKIGIRIGDDADADVLAEFTGGKEAVLDHINNSIVRKIIKSYITRS